MDKFAGKAVLKELVENKDNQQNQIHSLKQALMSIYQKMYQMDAAIQQNQRVGNALDFRTRALSQLLERAGVTEKQIREKVEELQVEQFERDSAEDDKNRNLVAAEGPAQNGLFATTTIRLFKDGVEVENEKIVRSKIELGKSELLPEVDQAIAGMSVGDTKTFALDLQGRTDTAELTLLSLKKVAEPESKEEKSATENQ